MAKRKNKNKTKTIKKIKRICKGWSNYGMLGRKL